MAVTAGAITVVSKTATTAVLESAAATAGVGPYTYQWYRSTTSGFTPGVGNAISGATALTLEDSGLIPGTTYYYAVVATDTGDSDATDESAQQSLVTDQEVPNPNQFSQKSILGMLDLRFNPNTVAVQIDASETSALYAGQAVKMVDSAGGVPKVVKCAADSDEVLGFINYNIKNDAFLAGMAAEISMNQNVQFLRATGPIARGSKVVLDLTSVGGVAAATGSTGSKIVGWAYDKAVAAGDLFRVFVETPSFSVDS